MTPSPSLPGAALAGLAPRAYRLRMSDLHNMRYLQSNSTFSAAGGAEGPSNQFGIYGVRIVRVK